MGSLVLPWKRKYSALRCEEECARCQTSKILDHAKREPSELVLEGKNGPSQFQYKTSCKGLKVPKLEYVHQPSDKFDISGTVRADCPANFHHGGENSCFEVPESSDFGNMSMPIKDIRSNCLDGVDLIHVRTNVSQCGLSEFECVKHINQAVKSHEALDPGEMLSKASKKQCIQSGKNTASGELSSYWSKLCDFKSEPCNSPRANPKNLPHHHSSLSALKISELQAYNSISQRKIWIVRNFPNDCGRTIKVGKHSISKGVSGTQVDAVFLKGAKQEEEPAPTKQIKLTARKSNNLQDPTRKSNTLLRPEFHYKNLPVVSGIQVNAVFLKGAKQEEEPAPTKQIKLTARKSNNLQDPTRKSNTFLRPEFHEKSLPVVSGTQVSAVFLKGAKQGEEPAPTKPIKLTARKSNNLQDPTRKSNTLLRPKFHDKNLPVVSGTQVGAVFLRGAKQEEEPAPTKLIKLTARKFDNLQDPTRKSNTSLRPKFYDKNLPVVPPHLKKTCKSNAFSGASKSADAIPRDRVRDILRLFQALCRKFLQEKESHQLDNHTLDMVHNKHNRVDLKAFGLLKEEGMLLAKGTSFVGDVPGIEVGDEFHYRVELCLTGIHKPPMAGIDFMKINGKQVATSIVSSGMYSDIMEGSDVLVYEGEGGGFVTSNSRRKPQPGDQKLVRGNLALANSIETQLPVRVTFGFREQKPSEAYDGKMRILSTYVYDGLYKAEKYWSEIGNKGFSVFKFRLRRIPNQPQIPLKEVMMLKQSKIRLGLCRDDISLGKEEKPIAVINTVDKELPPPFEYMARMKYPSWYKRRQPQGCNCIGECVDPRICKCAAKNGGDFPFNYDEAIVRAKRLVYECGPSCRCSSSCHNRVSQHGIKFQLEIFKTETKGWGVHSLGSIPSGSFVCEYTGELLAESEAQERVCDDYLFAIGRNYNDEALWKGLSAFIPDLQEDDNDEEAEDASFAIDGAKYGGVGRFINHSCSPNLYAQNVLYDHDDKRVPHIMLFAAENIPPLKELSYHYNYAIDQVHDLKGNIKKKTCHCGAARCTGRLY